MVVCIHGFARSHQPLLAYLGHLVVLRDIRIPAKRLKGLFLFLRYRVLVFLGSIGLPHDMHQDQKF